MPCCVTSRDAHTALELATDDGTWSVTFQLGGNATVNSGQTTAHGQWNVIGAFVTVEGAELGTQHWLWVRPSPHADRFGIPNEAVRPWRCTEKFAER